MKLRGGLDCYGCLAGWKSEAGRTAIHLPRLIQKPRSGLLDEGHLEDERELSPALLGSRHEETLIVYLSPLH